MDVPLNIVLMLVGAAGAWGGFKYAFARLQKDHDALKEAFDAHLKAFVSSSTSQGSRLGQVEELGRGLEGRMNGFMAGFDTGRRTVTLPPKPLE